MRYLGRKVETFFGGSRSDCEQLWGCCPAIGSEPKDAWPLTMLSPSSALRLNVLMWQNRRKGIVGIPCLKWRCSCLFMQDVFIYFLRFLVWDQWFDHFVSLWVCSSHFGSKRNPFRRSERGWNMYCIFLKEFRKTDWMKPVERGTITDCQDELPSDFCKGFAASQGPGTRDWQPVSQIHTKIFKRKRWLDWLLVDGYLKWPLHLWSLGLIYGAIIYKTEAFASLLQPKPQWDRGKDSLHSGLYEKAPWRRRSRRKRPKRRIHCGSAVVKLFKAFLWLVFKFFLLVLRFSLRKRPKHIFFFTWGSEWLQL